MTAVNDIPIDTYVETSALLSSVFVHESGSSASISFPGRCFTSALTIAEANRGVTKARLGGLLGAAEERRVIGLLERFFLNCDVVAVSDEILLRAGRDFPAEPLRTLDAIHLATVVSSGMPARLVRVVTRDRRVRANAIAMGYAVD